MEKFVYVDPGYETRSVVDDLNDSLQKMGKAAQSATNTINALMEVLDVDPMKMKKVLLYNALKDLADGKEPVYEGNLYKDLFEMIQKLEMENEDLNIHVKSLDESCDKYLCAESNHQGKIYKAKNALNRGVILPHVGKGLYSGASVNQMLLKTYDAYNEVINDALKALNDEDPPKTETVRLRLPPWWSAC
jgi:hypothetical protein